MGQSCRFNEASFRFAEWRWWWFIFRTSFAPTECELRFSSSWPPKVSSSSRVNATVITPGCIPDWCYRWERRRRRAYRSPWLNSNRRGTVPFGESKSPDYARLPCRTYAPVVRHLAFISLWSAMLSIRLSYTLLGGSPSMRLSRTRNLVPRRTRMMHRISKMQLYMHYIHRNNVCNVKIFLNKFLFVFVFIC